MSNFNKFLGLAGAVVVFAGLANAQLSCGLPTTTPAVLTTIDRAEGTTELLPTQTIACTGTAPAGTITVQAFYSLPVTSKAIGSGLTEAQISGGTAPVQGTVSGTNVLFSSVAVAAGTYMPAAPLLLSINNVRVNASTAGVTAGGAPVTVSAQYYVSGPTPVVTPTFFSISNIAFLQNGLAAAALSTSNASVNGKVNAFTVCGSALQSSSSSQPAALAFYIAVSENFPTAFKTAAGEASQVAVTGSSTNNAVADGTRVQVTFANVPANVTLYTQATTIQSTTGGDVLTYTNSAAGTAAQVGPVTSPSGAQFANLAAITLANGTGTAVFEETTADPATSGKFFIPFYVAYAAYSVPQAGASAFTATVSLSPVGSTVIPNFTASSATTLTGSAFNACTTSLLFPFVTNMLGFDTGIAIANTSTDPAGNATPSSGTCALTFYGTNAPTTAFTTPAPVGATSATSTNSGPVYTTTASTVAPNFQGYMIAVCNFLDAHGFAFISGAPGTGAAGLSEGYLPLVLNRAGAPNIESLGF